METRLNPTIPESLKEFIPSALSAALGREPLGRELGAERLGAERLGAERLGPNGLSKSFVSSQKNSWPSLRIGALSIPFYNHLANI